MVKNEQGRWVGDDGFAVPRTFTEYVEEHPDHLLTMARSIGGYEDAGDLAQTFAVKLLTSKTIEKFDPAKVGGVTAGQFFAYVNLCLRRHAATCWRSESREPSVCEESVGLDTAIESVTTLTEEQLHEARAVPIAPWNPDDKIWLDGFRAWLIEQGHEEYIAIMEAIATEGTLTGAGEALGLPQRAIHYRVKRLRELGLRYGVGGSKSLIRRE